MKSKRIVSLLLGLVMVLALLPMTALAVTEITTITVTIDEPVSGQTLPTTATVAQNYLQVTKVEWTESTVNGELADTVHVYLEIKPGADYKFPKSGLTATVNGQSANRYYSEKGTTVEVAYSFSRHESAYVVPKANPVNVTYDTFDYRAYANIYPDLKTAYGYDAQKLWAHYVNYGRDEGRVAFAISASDNPKSGATIYKNAAAGTSHSDSGASATVPATYLDTLPPSTSEQAYDPWQLHQLTSPHFMSNAKLVAEYLSLLDVIDNRKTGWNLGPVSHCFSLINSELLSRSQLFESVYCYENGLNAKFGAFRVRDEADLASLKSKVEYQRAAQSDGIILIHWMYGYMEGTRREQIFPTPPANPGTAGQTSTTTPTAPAGPAVSLTKQNLTVNGAAKNTEIYNIDGSNYFKLRDMAALLNGTGSQFSVDFNSATSTIVVKTGAAYTLAGGELATGTDKSSTATASKQSIEIDGKKADLTAYNIGGNNFFKLRDLGAALNFDVDYDSATSTMIVKSK